MNRSTDNPALERKAYATCVIGGAALWLLTSLLTGRSEAWDSSWYWTLTYPLTIFLAGFVACWVPHKAWRWGLVVIMVQALVMLVTTDGSFGLLPLGLLLFGILSFPAMVLAALVAWGCRRWGKP